MKEVCKLKLLEKGKIKEEHRKEIIDNINESEMKHDNEYEDDFRIKIENERKERNDSYKRDLLYDEVDLDNNEDE